MKPETRAAPCWRPVQTIVCAPASEAPPGDGGGKLKLDKLQRKAKRLVQEEIRCHVSHVAVFVYLTHKLLAFMEVAHVVVAYADGSGGIGGWGVRKAGN